MESRGRYKNRWVHAAVVALASAAVPAQADVITDWNATTFQVGGPLIPRTLAMVHVAAHDAVNSIEPRYHPYAFKHEVTEPTLPAAAVVGAAYGVLIRRFPGAQAILDQAKADSLANLPAGPPTDAGLALGDLIASEVLALRAADNMLLPNPPYTPGSGPGAYQLTPPNFAAPVNTGAPSWVPFALDHPAQFRPNGPPGLHSYRYARNVEEVRILGAVDSTVRTEEQSLIANWHVEQGQLSINRIARTETIARALPLHRSARLFALLNLAFIDATLSVFEAKYHYDSWRPVTAIREAGADGNPWTEPDPDWMPFLLTPPHPEYPAAHAVVGGAGLQVLEAVFGKHYRFSATSASVPGVTRSFESFDAFLEDAKAARIYGGMHFREAVEEGGRQGRRVGRWVVSHFLRPCAD